LRKGHGVAADPVDAENIAVGDAVAMVVFAGDDKIAAAGRGALSEPHRRAIGDQAEVDQVVADPAGQFTAALPVGGDQQHVLPGEPLGDRGADRGALASERGQSRSSDVRAVAVMAKVAKGYDLDYGWAQSARPPGAQTTISRPSCRDTNSCSILEHG
jgi:hypothetical protein